MPKNRFINIKKKEVYELDRLCLVEINTSIIIKILRLSCKATKVHLMPSRFFNGYKKARSSVVSVAWNKICLKKSFPMSCKCSSFMLKIFKNWAKKVNILNHIVLRLDDLIKKNNRWFSTTRYTTFSTTRFYKSWFLYDVNLHVPH